MTVSIDLIKVQNELLDSSLKYHYLLVNEQLRNRRPSRIAALGESLREFFSPHPRLREECSC